MALVPGTVQECHRTSGRGPDYDRQLVFFEPEFITVLFLELWPTFGFVSKPLPQFRAWSKLLKPQIDTYRFLLDASRPEPIYKNSSSVGGESSSVRGENRTLTVAEARRRNIPVGPAST